MRTRAETGILAHRGDWGVSAMTANARSTGVMRLITCSVVLVAMWALALALPVAAHARTWHVSVVGDDPTADGTPAKPFASVQSAVATAHAGDVVSVGAGVFSGDVTMTVSVSLQGAGASLTTLRGDGKNSVIHADGIGEGATISGFTITGGAATYGGGIYLSFSSPTITNNTIIGNTGYNYGGGILCSFSSPTIRGNTIVGNQTSGGGGIACDSSSPSIDQNTISDNSAGLGGGIYCLSIPSAATITSNTIFDNSASDGAGILCCYSSSPQITGNSITGNIASQRGGGIDCFNLCWPTISGNTINGNRATNEGGGICCETTSSPVITRDSIIGNSSQYGGGIWSDLSTPTVTNDVIAANSATTQGGGIYVFAAGSTIINDTIADNIDGAGGNGGGGIWCASGTQSATNCIIWGNSSLDHGCTLAYCDFLGMPGHSGNISGDPLFVAPESGDYHLSAGSRCIDNATSTAVPTVDRDGIPRPWGTGCDRGAYEYYVSAYHTTTSLSAPRSVKVKKSLSLSGRVSPSGVSPYAPPGAVTITMTRKVGRRWKSAGSAGVGLVGGAFTYSFKPRYKGSWHFVATYSGGAVGPTTYFWSRSGTPGTTVK